jgi:hypothetical protein
MKAAYIFLSPGHGIHHLMIRILPQLESSQHGLTVVAMCFFDENASVLEPEHPYSDRIMKVASENNIQLLIAEKTDLIRSGKESTEEKQIRLKPTECVVTAVNGVEQIACFPNIYAAVGAANHPDHIICL